MRKCRTFYYEYSYLCYRVYIACFARTGVVSVGRVPGEGNEAIVAEGLLILLLAWSTYIDYIYEVYLYCTLLRVENLPYKANYSLYIYVL